MKEYIDSVNTIKARVAEKDYYPTVGVEEDVTCTNFIQYLC